MLVKIIRTWALLLTICAPLAAQEVVRWTLSSEKSKNDLSQGESIALTLRGEIDPGWHLYALDQPAGGPIPTTIGSADESLFVLTGEIKAPQPTVEPDPNFVVDGKPLETKYYEKSVEFFVNGTAAADTPANSLALNVRFQLCNETFCLPPKTLRVSFNGTEPVARSSPPSASTQNPTPIVRTSTASNDLWAFLWLAVTFGAISLLTPCVFPMIPITVSYFMNHARGDRSRSIKLAFVYSAGIIATFSLLGMALAVFLGAAGINLFAANPWVNLVIAAIFLLFAFNLFGFYEISIPAAILTKLDKLTRAEEGKGSAYIGALLMGLTFTLTSLTCTSPFVGTILVSTSQGDWKMPLIGMFAFSTVFALPFFVLALVPRILHSLPRSGGWLNSVKVIMGFLEVAAAIKFLSNVDLIWGSGLAGGVASNYGWILTRELVLLIWILIGLGIFLYIIGLFRFRYDVAVARLSPLRMFFALVFFSACIYLGTGVLGRTLGELESFLPPKNADSVFNLLGDRENELTWITNDVEKARLQASAQGRRIFVDFTGYTCTNCRWMEANMFPQPRVRSELEKFVRVRLYTDGAGEIFERQQQFEQDLFGTVALPYYAVLDANGRVISNFPGLTRSADEFVDFLKSSQEN